MRRQVQAAIAGMVILLGVAWMLFGMRTAPASAQRDPDYAEARRAGVVGEKADGYLAIVGAATPELRRLVQDINIRRRAHYTERAQAQHVLLEQYAFTQGCILIQRTAQGEKYQAPDGAWQTRGAGPAQLDERCP